MTTDIFIKSYQNDYPFLAYCLRSIAKFASGFNRIVVVVDEKCAENPPVGTNETLVRVHRGGAGYMWQQIVKLLADRYSEADQILYMDSDTIFTRPITPEDVMRDGKPIWLMEAYEKLADPQAQTRQPIVSRFIGEDVQHEFMRRHPHLIHRAQLKAIRDFCQAKHGMDIEAYAFAEPSFSEFNIMGAYQYHFAREAAVFLQPEEIPTFVMQGYSWGGFTAEVRQKYEDLLA